MRASLEALVWVLLGMLAVTCAVFIRIAIVGGGSMEPALVRGDLCVALRRADVSLGDIVLYRTPDGGDVVHRVVGMCDGGELVTCGDANDSPDRAPISPQRVRGRVVVVVPMGRAARGWMRSVRDATLLTQSR